MYNVDNIEHSFYHNKIWLMEGALGERLKREFLLEFDEHVVMAKLVQTEEGRQALYSIWSQYLEIAKNYQLPFLATTPTRRANKQRVERSREGKGLILDNVAYLRELQCSSNHEMYVGGMIGCKGDAYTGKGALDVEEAKSFHCWQIESFYESKVDFIYAALIPSLKEVLGISSILSDSSLPYIISFTIQQDGKLIDGTKISDAIECIDQTVIHPPLCYMTNCVHPSIVNEALKQPYNQNEIVLSRFLGIQGNTSPLHYSMLDGAKNLFCSEPEQFACDMEKLYLDHHLKIYGGCCGTDGRHMEAMANRLSKLVR